MGKHHKELKNRLNELRKEVKMTQQSPLKQWRFPARASTPLKMGVYIPTTVLALKIAKVLNCKNRGYLRVALSFIWSRLNGANGQAMNSEVIA